MTKMFAVLLVMGGMACAQDPKTLVLSSRITLSDVEGRIDHFSADTKGHRLFMSALGNHTLEVLDIQNAKRLHTIHELAEPQGVLYDAATNRLFVAGAKDGTTKVFDGGSYKLIDTVKFASNADNVRYDAHDRRILVGYGDGALGFLDANGKRLGEVALDGHPESFQLEHDGSRAFVNVPNSQEIEVVDLSKKSVVSKWPVTSALKNFPMALDEPDHRLLIGCRAPARMLAIDTESGKQTASLDIVGDTDDLFYDGGRKRVYVIGGQGFVDVFEQKDADHYEHIDHIATAPGARTGLFVPDWRMLFVAVPHRGEQRAEVLVFEAK